MLLSILAAPLVIGASSPVQEEVMPWFEEVSAKSDLDFEHVTGARGKFWFPEIMGGGVAFVDVNGDGFLDIYCIQSGFLPDPAESVEERAAHGTFTNKLFLNLGPNEAGDFKFQDISESAGVDHAGYGMGVACADYDRDGDIDMYVTNVGQNVLYQNITGEEVDASGAVVPGVRFKDATDPATTIGMWSTSAAFIQADNDRDGKLDLFVTNNIGWTHGIENTCKNYFQATDYCNPIVFNSPQSDALLVQGRLGFRDLSANIVDHKGNGLGVAPCDFNDDSWTDIYVANDATANVLWLNRALTKKSEFNNTATEMTCGVNRNGTPEAGMGVQWSDIDGDGDFDIFITHLRREKNTYYEQRKHRSTGAPQFSDQSMKTGMNEHNMRFTGFGTGIHDFDLDGRLDIYVVNGAVQKWEEKEAFRADNLYAEPNHLFRGMEPKIGSVPHFEIQADGGTADQLIGTSRGAAFGDYDNDGDVDVVYMDLDDGVRLLKNVAERQGNWIGFSTLDKRGKPVPGARVGVVVEGGVIWRLAEPAYSYLSSNDPRVSFGLGAVDEVKEIIVKWIGGGEERFEPQAVGSYHTLRQGRGKK
jgi:enediyne biosynthesis protein E4